jgi:hypothetical protein
MDQDRNVPRCLIEEAALSLAVNLARSLVNLEGLVAPQVILRKLA